MKKGKELFDSEDYRGLWEGGKERKERKKIGNKKRKDSEEKEKEKEKIERPKTLKPKPTLLSLPGSYTALLEAYDHFEKHNKIEHLLIVSTLIVSVCKKGGLDAEQRAFMERFFFFFSNYPLFLFLFLFLFLLC